MNKSSTLSIVMMIKNEEKYLDKTLKSLMPLMSDIDSELIILDTGSTDSSIDIAKKYTDKIYFHEWNDNFSEMRNISISYAKGEWILILDADEELITYDRLKDFFNNGIYKEYNSASIELKNLYTVDEKKYSLASMIRLFKRTNEFKYIGSIHEQPLFKQPIYNSGAMFKHYGYIFINEEIRQLKDSRNKMLLLNELKNNPYNPYINYQLGKQYMISNNYEEAIEYMENAYSLYLKTSHIPIFVISDLACLYIQAGKEKKCEKICNNYIKKDSFNIDMYYYLAVSQELSTKYSDSIESYKRYLYLLDNYDITTQANNIECYGNTISYKEQCEIKIIINYYKLEKYNEVIYMFNEFIHNKKKNNEVYIALIDSLYKTDNLESIKKYYEKLCDTESDKNEFILAIEKLILIFKNEVEIELIEELKGLSGSYGILNKIRLGEKINTDVIKSVLQIESFNFYGDIIYKLFKEHKDIIEVLKGIEVFKLYGYIDYIVSYKKDVVVELYEFLINEPITNDINKIKIYKCISKSLLFNGGLFNEKYEELFYMYKYYTTLLFKETYNSKLTEDELINLIVDNDDRFIMKINMIEKMRFTNGVTYIKSLNKLLLEYSTNKKIIELLIEQFNRAFKEDNEMKELKNKYKNIIEHNLNIGKILDSKMMIREYENIFGEEVDTLNMKFIVALTKNEFKFCEILLKRALIRDKNNINTIFNIAYLKEILGEAHESILLYKKILNESKDEKIILEVREKIKLLNKQIN